MYTLESLSAINQDYCGSHCMIQADVDNVNRMVEIIEKSREGISTPMIGDTIHFTERYGVYYDGAMLIDDNKFGNGNAELCYNPYAPWVSEEHGQLRMSVSGGPFGCHPPQDFAYAGDAVRRFAIWGSCGPQANGRIDFDARVHLWVYREPNPLYGDFSTKDWALFYVDKIKNARGYEYKVTAPGGTHVHAFRNEKEYLAWLRTYRGVEFKGSWVHQLVVFCYKRREKLLSKEEWDRLPLPTDTREMNCSNVLVKVRYEDAAHMINEYRYENSGSRDGIPYRVAADDVANDRVKREIHPRSDEQ